MSNTNNVPKLYQTVVEDVINNVREAFLDEGMDDVVLQELKQLWENKLQQSKAIESVPKQDQVLAAFAQHQSNQRQQQATRKASAATTATHSIISTQQGTSGQIGAPIQVLSQNNPGSIGLSGPAASAAMALPAGLYQQQLLPGTIITGQGGVQYIVQPSSLVQPGQTQTVIAPQHQQPTNLTQAAFALTATQLSQQQAQAKLLQQNDGPNDSSSEEDFDKDDDDDDDDDDDNDEQNDDKDDDQGEEEEPLNSNDDVSDEDPTDLFDTDNVVVCQYDKINRSKNKWKFHLKDGIMNLNGRDFVLVILPPELYMKYFRFFFKFVQI